MTEICMYDLKNIENTAKDLKKKTMQTNLQILTRALHKYIQLNLIYEHI